MAAQPARQLHREFEAAVNAGDIDRLMALYEPACALLLAPDQLLSGLDAVRGAQLGLLALHGTFRIETRLAVEVGELALLSGAWTFDGTGEDGASVTLGGVTADVARRQPDGSWRYIIDVPRVCPEA
jgi:ketosteroid isomerase-like protein